MEVLWIPVLAAVGTLLAFHLWLFLRCAACLDTRSPTPSDDCLPAAEIILCLRGADPFLEECLTGLTSQDYPEAHVSVVIDSRADPAWSIVESFIRQHAPSGIAMIELDKSYTRCSRKIASLLTATQHMDPDRGVVALIDADVIPSPQWLRDLAAPLSDSTVGLSTGNRWYLPPISNMGSIVRFQWNAFAVPTMSLLGIAWGGSLAVRGDTIRDPVLQNRLTTAFGEDATLARFILERGQQVRLVPEALMPNFEICTLPQFEEFLLRQLLCVQLHPRWWSVFGIGLWGYLTLISSCVAAAILPYPEAGYCLSALVAYLIGMTFAMSRLDNAARTQLARRGEVPPAKTLRNRVMNLLMLPVTQGVYVLQLIHSLFVRHHVWRGVRYRFERNSQVRVIHDQPLADAVPSPDPVPLSIS